VSVPAKGKLATYIHGGSKIGVMLDLIGGDDGMGKDLAMHIAASKPKAMDASGVPADVIEAERRIATEKAAEDAAKSGKQIPPDILAKRVDGSVQKILKELTLLGQPFVKNDKQTVEQLLKASNATVASFTLYIVGEGLEKKKDDFADEVKRAVEQAKKNDDDGKETV
jgi:elongation factor Ts